MAIFTQLGLLWLATGALAVAIADHAPVPACPACFTSTVWTARVCGKPHCTRPASTPAPTPTLTGQSAPTSTTECTVTVDLVHARSSTTIVMNTNVCSVTPTVTRIFPCPAAPPCVDTNAPKCKTEYLSTVPAGSTVEGGPDVTYYLTDCSAPRTPWIQPLPSDYKPTPPLPPTYLYPSSVSTAVEE